MNWFKLECTTRAFVTALQLTVRYEMSVIIIIIISPLSSAQPRQYVEARHMLTHQNYDLTATPIHVVH